MLGCKAIRAQLSDALDGALPWWKRLAQRLHLPWCRTCRHVDESLKQTLATLKQLRDVPPE